MAAITRRGHRVQPIARSHGIDLLDKGQVVNALRGVDVVVDVANVDTTTADVSTTFFTRATSNLMDGCRKHGVSRYVVLSIVGVDRGRAMRAGALLPAAPDFIGEESYDQWLQRSRS